MTNNNYKEKMEEFKKKWCKTPDSGLLSPFCHIDDVCKLVDKALDSQQASFNKKVERLRVKVAYKKGGKHSGKSWCPQCEDEGYNQALEDLLKALKDKE